MKLGRKPRTFDHRIPHLSAYIVGRRLTAPVAVDYTRGMPSNLGAMGNDRLGDCTCAAVYHALQVWTFNAQNAIETEPDSNVLALYEQACGYNPADPSTDQGGIEQAVLRYLVTTGAPVNGGRHKLAAFVEVDPRNTDDVKAVIADCGVAYIGFNVPQYLTQTLTGSGAVWDIQIGNDAIVGGHAVVIAGYNSLGVRVISWGSYYTMTWAFWAKYVDECYALCDTDWIESTGVDPAGLSLPQLETAMESIKWQP